MPEAEYFSANRLKNPSAETGDLTDWDHENASVVLGGVEGDYCFRLEETGHLKQILTIPGQPGEFKVKGYFLPEEDPPQGSVEVNAWIEVLYEYGDGTFDEIRFPFRNDVYAILHE